MELSKGSEQYTTAYKEILMLREALILNGKLTEAVDGHEIRNHVSISNIPCGGHFQHSVRKDIDALQVLCEVLSVNTLHEPLHEMETSCAEFIIA